MKNSTRENSKSVSSLPSLLLKSTVLLLLLVFYGTLLAHTMNLPAADDLPRQIKIGETIVQGNWDILYRNIYSYTEPDHTFYNHHWLSGVAFYLLHQVLGWSGLVIFKVVIFLAAFLIVFFTAQRKADFWLVAWFSLPAIFILRERTGLRPEVFSYLLIAIYLYLLVDLEDHPERQRIYWLIPLQLLWVNLHVFFSIGLMMVGGFWVAMLLKSRRKLRGNTVVKKLTFLLVAMTLVSFLNPRGADGVFYRYPSNFPIRISENQWIIEFLRMEPVGENISIAVFAFLVPLLALSFIPTFRQRKVSLFYLLASIATIALSFVILRGMAFFGFIFLLAITANLNNSLAHARTFLARTFPRTLTVLRRTLPVTLLLITLALIYPGWGALSKYKEPGLGAARWSEDSAAFFREQKLRGPIFNDADIGSYLIYHLYPQEKVFLDNRFADAYSAGFVSNTFFPALADEEKWQASLRQYNFNTIFFYHYDATPHSRDFLWRRMRDPEWAFVYGDPFAVILVRQTPANEAVIKQWHITRDNVEERFRPLTTSARFEDQVAAADLYNLMGRDDLAKGEYFEIVNRWPERGKVWMILGQMALSYEDDTSTVLALMFFDKAIAQGYATAEAYSFLGAAYARAQQPEKAKEVLRRALKINPEREDARILLDKIVQDIGE